MQKLLTICLTLSLFSCVSAPQATQFDGKWVFVKDKEGEQMACLKRGDVIKLRAVLISCKEAHEH